jgi:sarcosine dehydrogenase
MAGSYRERMDEYKRLHEMGKYYGIESHILTPSEVKDVHPLLAVDDVFGAVYSPTDGTIDPTGAVNAYAAGARAAGARIFEDVGVASIESIETPTGRPEVTGVRTTSGHVISAPIVINACGAWANKLALTVGTRLPLLAMKHAFVVTEGIEGMTPALPNVRDHDLSIYLKTQGNAIALGG